MSWNIELAGAARRVRSLAERLPGEHRPDVSDDWQTFLDSIEGQPDEVALSIIADWLEEMEERLTPSRLDGAEAA